MKILLILLILGAGFVVIFLRRMLRHSLRINDYFANAIRVYGILGEEDAKVAALAAAKVAAGKQRDSMLAYLAGLASDFGQISPENNELRSQWKLAIGRLSELKKEIGARDWTTSDMIQEKQRLQNLNPEYLKALERADPNVFTRKYPRIFRDLVS